MAQAGILGSLEYRNDQHGWALDLGHLSARYELISGSITDQRVPGLNQARRDVVRDMNAILTNNRIRYTIPEFVPGVAIDHHQMCGDLIEYMRRDSTPTLLAFYLIGNAVYFLHIEEAASSSKHDGELTNLALNRLKNIAVRCPGIQIDPQGLLARFRTADISPTGIRLLLRNLQKPLVILLVSADPIDEAPLRQQQEFRQLNRALQGSEIKNAFKVEFLPDCRPEDLAAGIRLHKPTILHFSGHGSKAGLCFVGRDGKKVIIEPARLAGLLKIACSEGLKGVVLNACHTERYADCIAQAVGEVVAMQGPIGDEEAILFAKEFYGGLGDGRSFETSFQWALASAGMVDSAGPLKPCLIKASPRRHVTPGSQPSMISGPGRDNRSRSFPNRRPTSTVKKDESPSSESEHQAQPPPRRQISVATDSIANMSLDDTARSTSRSKPITGARPGGREPRIISSKSGAMRSEGESNERRPENHKGAAGSRRLGL